MRVQLLSLMALIAVANGGMVVGQDPLDEIYGRAVHSYFRGDLEKSRELLEEVIGAGSVDPRVFYFRGLATACCGDIESALPDFERAAELEIEGKKVVNVGKALERIQGPNRVEIEKIRSRARLNSRSRVLEMQRSRYDSMQRQGGTVDGGLLVPPKAGIPSPLTPNDPFNTGMTKGQPQTVETPAEQSVVPAQPTEATPPAPAPADDPFGAPATPTTPPADDPFGTGSK